MAEQNTESTPEWAREILENSASTSEWFRNMMEPAESGSSQQLPDTAAPQESETEAALRGLCEAHPDLQRYIDEFPIELLEAPITYQEMEFAPTERCDALHTTVNTTGSTPQIPSLQTYYQFQANIRIPPSGRIETEEEFINCFGRPYQEVRSMTQDEYNTMMVAGEAADVTATRQTNDIQNVSNENQSYTGATLLRQLMESRP